MVVLSVFYFFARQADLIVPARPYLCNEYGVHAERGILPRWLHTFDLLRDNHGAALLADYESNQLIVVLTDNALFVHGAQDRATLKFEEHRVEVRRADRDRLIVILADGTTREFPLGPGEAEHVRSPMLHGDKGRDIRAALLASACGQSPGLRAVLDDSK